MCLLSPQKKSPDFVCLNNQVSRLVPFIPAKGHLPLGVFRTLEVISSLSCFLGRLGKNPVNFLLATLKLKKHTHKMCFKTETHKKDAYKTLARKNVPNSFVPDNWKLWLVIYSKVPTSPALYRGIFQGGWYRFLNQRIRGEKAAPLHQRT